MGDNDNLGDGVYKALEAMDGAAQPPTVAQAITRLRAHGFSAEVDVLLGQGDAAWSMLRGLRDSLRRLDPAWCKLNGQTQISDEEFDEAMAELEDLLEMQP